MRETRYE